MEQRLQVGEALEVHDVEAKYSEWRRALEAQPSGVVLDVTGLSRIDTAGIQLLVAIGREAARKGVAFTLTDAAQGDGNGALRGRAETLGLAAAL